MYHSKRYDVYKGDKLIFENLTAKEISKLIGRCEKSIKNSANQDCELLNGYSIVKTLETLKKEYNGIDCEWDREVKEIKELCKKVLKNKNIVTSSARGYRK